RCRLLEAADHPEGRRLAAARRAEQAEELPVADIQVDVVDGGGVAEFLDHVDEPDGDFWHCALRGTGSPQAGGDGRLGVRSRPPRDLLPVAFGWPRIGAIERGCQEREARSGRPAGPRDSNRSKPISREIRIARDGAASCAARRRPDRQPARPVRGTMRISTHRPSEGRAPVAPRSRGPRSPMPTLTEATILDALRQVQEPELGRDIVTLNMVKSIAIDGSSVAFTIELTTPACPLKDEIEGNARTVLAGIGAEAIEITWGAMVRRATPQQAEAILPN